MQHVFLDFEMNPIPKKNTAAREFARSEIIEIGAVKLNDDYELVGRFSCYVKPELNQIMLNITKLTGITNATVGDAKCLSDALAEFTAWIGEEPVKIYAWSDSDKKQIVQECALKGLAMPRQFRRWMDFQRVYTRLVGLSKRSNLSLRHALGSVEQGFAGAQHRAVDDAENSASLLTLVKDREAFAARTKMLNSFFNEGKAATTTLGDLFADTFALLRSQTA